MTPFLSLRISRFFSIDAGRGWQHGYLGRRGLFVSIEARLKDERRAWIERGICSTTGRLGPLAFTLDR